MDSIVLSRRRGTLAITIAILKAARSGLGKTQLLYMVGLNYDQLCRYLEFLEANDFIEANHRLYQTTRKGLKLIEEFETSPLMQRIVTT